MENQASTENRQRTARRLAAAIALVWVAIGIAAALTMPAFGSAGATLEVRTAIAACGAAAALLTALFLYRATSDVADAPVLFIGHLIAIPPALQLGLTGAEATRQLIALYWPLGALPLYCLTLVVIASAVSSVGSIAALAIAQVAADFAHGVFAVLGVKPRPFPWRAARMTLLVAFLCGTLVYAGQKLGYLTPRDDVPASSAWIEREKNIFSDVVAAHPVEVVVLPVQVQGPSFDRIERSLMTRYLARQIERAGLRVADPTLLARALDVRTRRIDMNEAQALAASAGARILIESQVSRSGDRLTLESTIWRRPDAAWERAGAAKLSNLPWSDTSPASLAIQNTIATLAEKLGLPPAKPAPADAPATQVPMQDLAAFASAAHGGPEQRAQALQLFGALHRRESLHGQGLWERSLIAAADAAPGVGRRALEARAYLHLSRRPAALALLGEPQNDEERFLVAILNGDVPGAEQAIPGIADPMQRLLAELELADLLDAFDFDKRIVERRAAVVGRLEGMLAASVSFRMAHTDWFNAEIHRIVATELPPAKRWTDYFHDAFAILYPRLAWLYWLADPLSVPELELVAPLEHDRARRWRAHGADWAARPAADRPVAWDYYDLLYSMNERSALKTLHSMLFMQGLPERAVRICEFLQWGPFDGHPSVTLLLASALDRAGRKKDPYQAQAMFTRSSALALATYRWEGGESDISWPAEHLIFGRKYEKYVDEPLRWYRTRTVAAEREALERLRFSAREMTQFIAEDKRRLLYSDRYVAPLKDVVGWLRRSGRMEEAETELQANRHRFIGAAMSAELFAEAEEARRTGDAKPYFRKLLEMHPDSWSARWRLAALHLESGEPAEAQALFLAYPPFQNPGIASDRVRLSNVAFEAGDLLHRSGEQALALPLFHLSAGMRTGSSRSLRSQEALAIAANDVGEAMNVARMRLRRYHDAGAGSRLVAYQSLLGRAADADAMLAEFLNRFDDEAVWTAAFLVHRMRGLDAAGAETWLARAAQASGRPSYFNAALRERHAFMLAMIDRVPDTSAVALVQRIARANNGSPFYGSLAEAYAAMHAGQYAAAAAKFRGPLDDLLAISVNRRTALVDVLPYAVYSYSRARNGVQAEKLLTDYRNLVGVDADYLMARALVDGSAGDHDAAEASLRRAFYRLPPLSTRTFFGGYVLLDACELLLKETGETRYRRLIADFARRLQVQFPYPWAATFEARYATDPQARDAALAAAQVLDPASPRLVGLARMESGAVRTALGRDPGLLGSIVRAGVR